MSRNRKAQSLSLFPFLAVLICTMGVLVALLLLVVKQAEQTGKDEQGEQTAALRQQLDDLELQMAELALRNQLLEDRRQDYQAQLARQRDELGHLENEMSRVRDEAETFLAQRAANRAAQAATPDRDLQQQVLAEQAAQLQELRQALTAAQAKLRIEGQQSGPQAAPVYSIVPMAAQSGTNRRPIYIECRGDGIRLHPGGIPLTLDDFIMPLAPGNPLDAALLAYREYWRQALGSEAAQANAYPLMVVRPSGAKWYSVARRAMSGWDQEFGYELIPEDWEVNFGAVDPGLVQHVQQAIRGALSRQAALVAFGQATPAGQAMAVQPASATTSSDRALVPAEGGGFAAAPTLAALGSGNSQGRGPTARGEAGFAARGDQRGDPVARFSSDFHQSRPGDAAESGLRDPVADAGNPPARFSSSRQTPATPNLMAAVHSRATAPAIGSPATGSPKTGSAAEGAAATGFAAAGSAAADNPPQRGGLPPRAGANPPSGSARGSSPQSSAAAAAAGSPTAGSSPPNPMAHSGQTSEMASTPTSALDMSLNPQSLALQRGVDWALPSRRDAVSAYHRPIVVQITDNALVLPAGEGSPRAQTLPFSQSTAEAIDPLADAIWQRVDQWGYLGFGGYWKPVLELRYDPSAAAKARELQELLEGSGLEVKHPEPPTPGSRR
jgi:hypothetical protein